MSNKNISIMELARVTELEVGRTPKNPRRRMFTAECADGSICHLIIGWPEIKGEDESIHCADHASFNECEGAYRVGAVLAHEKHLAKMMEFEMTVVGLACGAPWPGSLALDEKPNPRLDERAIRVMR